MKGLCHVCWSSGVEVITRNGKTICNNCDKILTNDHNLCEKCGRSE